MQIRLLHYNHEKKSTSGLIAINPYGKGHEDAVFQCFTLEDEYREVKLRGHTRIWEDTYKIGWQEQITGMTQRYRDKFDWFDKHIHIKDVPQFTGIYIHIGNFEKDTDGCVLLADKAVNDYKDYASRQEASTVAYKRFYQIVQKALNAGEDVEIVIKSIWCQK